MRIDVGLCQIRPVMGDVDANADRVESELRDGRADVLITPELFLTGYGADLTGCRREVEERIARMSDLCRDTDRAVALGAPRFADDGVYNSIAFLSPDGDVWYDKIHLARFGIYSEDGFLAGDRPAIGMYHGIGFGLCVCYDVFFPEVLRASSVAGSVVNVCVAASAVPSKPFLDRVLPARALENVSYIAYVNNIGTASGLEMHGCTRGLDPFGDTVADCGTSESIAVMTVDTERVAECRAVRHNLDDFRPEIDWFRKRY